MVRDYILLTYERAQHLVNDEHPLSGRIACVEGDRTVVTMEFVDYTFMRMVILLSQIMRNHPALGVYIARSEHPNQLAVEVEESTRAMLRDDPIAAARALSEPQRRVVVRGQAPKDVNERMEHLMPAPIRAGYDTLADAFGHLVYLKLKDARVESPITGRWVDLSIVRGTDEPDRLRATCGPHNIVLGRLHPKWAAVGVDHLLSLTASRYWLPRAWNPGSWISHEDLKTKYEKFKEEASS